MRGVRPTRRRDGAKKPMGSRCEPVMACSGHGVTGGYVGVRCPRWVEVAGQAAAEAAP